jgi:hypothetical protein
MSKIRFGSRLSLSEQFLSGGVVDLDSGPIYSFPESVEIHSCRPRFARTAESLRNNEPLCKQFFAYGYLHDISARPEIAFFIVVASTKGEAIYQSAG